MMLSSVTIPKNLAKVGDLILIPRREYERLLNGQEKPAKRQLAELDRDLAKSITEYRAGKSYGPFENAKEAIVFLNQHRSRQK